MWFWFGIFTAFKLAAVAAYLRFDASWSGEPRRARGRKCEVSVSKSKDGAVVGVRVGVPCRADFRFTARRQTAVDNFFLKLGLAAEQTVQDVVFDDSVYLLSDDHRLGHLLRRDAKMRRAFARLLYKYNDDVMRVRHVRCGHGRLWVNCEPASASSIGLNAGLAAGRVIRALHRAAKGLAGPVTIPSDTPQELGAPTRPVEAPVLADSKGDDADERPHDRHALRAALLLTASTALCLNGVFQIGGAALSPLPIVLDNPSLVALSVLAGLACTLALLLLCVALLRKTSRVHVVAIELLLTGSFGCISTSYSVLRQVNARFDSVEPAFVDVAARRATRRCGKGNRTCYELHLGRGDKIEPRTLSVGFAEYRRFEDVNAARLIVHPGRLGFRWLARVEPVIYQRVGD